MDTRYSFLTLDRQESRPHAEYWLCLFFSVAVLLGGCATEKPAAAKSGPAANLITDFLTVEDSETFSVVVKGDRPLAYKATKQDSPLAIRLQFPHTGLDHTAVDSFTPQNDLIESIRAMESKGNGRETIVFIDLKRDVPFMVTAGGNDLRMVLNKSGAPTKKERVRIPASGAESAPTATILKKVIVTPGAKQVIIRVVADGMVKDCRAFTVETPAKIVVDCFGLHSDYEQQQKIPVKSAIVSLVRHFAHPGKVRVVAETQSPFLNSYLVEPAEDGFVIKIGKE